MTRSFKWGIIGPGRIANKFANALALVPGAILHAVASRDETRGQEFAGKHQAKKLYPTYAELAADKDIDAVYIATPHPYHHEPVLQCLMNGKAVLCEKPMSINVSSTREMIDTARSQGVFLMEAMWTRFLPTIIRTKQMIDEGQIGQLKYLSADFGFAAPFDPNSRLFNLALGGGSLLDVGVYPIFLALYLMGKPTGVKAYSTVGKTGVDEITTAMLYFSDEVVAHIASSIIAPMPITATITGTTATITLARPWYKGDTISLRKKDDTVENLTLPYGDNGFEFQVLEVQECLNAGRTESAKMPLDLSLTMAEVMEEICRQAGIGYRLPG